MSSKAGGLTQVDGRKTNGLAQMDNKRAGTNPDAQANAQTLTDKRGKRTM